MDIGIEIYSLCKELFPINRSITGDGVRETLSIIKREIPELHISEIDTGSQCFDWIVPQEWKCEVAYIIDPEGNKICDFSQNNLHVVGYSESVDKSMTLDELEEHLYSLSELPDAVPYITSYYKRRWGFCISDTERKLLKKGKYKVYIRSDLFDGSLTYGEVLIPGNTREEIFFSTYVCHPSMANNELSGPAVVTSLVKYIKSLKNRRYSYRVIFIPETIGSIVYLSKNINTMQKYMVAGFNVSCVGDDNDYGYLPSRTGKTVSDKVAVHVLNHQVLNYTKYSFLQRGSDERQYCSPNVNLPVSCITRSKYGEYKEYHTSLDNLDFISPSGLAGAYKVYARVIELLEHNYAYKPILFCEPQLGKRDLYPTLGVRDRKDDFVQNMLNFLAYCDGALDLIEVADEIKVPAWELFEIINVLLENKLIERV
jgi:aminopeptidase-like protein